MLPIVGVVGAWLPIIALIIAALCAVAVRRWSLALRPRAWTACARDERPADGAIDTGRYGRVAWRDDGSP